MTLCLGEQFDMSKRQFLSLDCFVIIFSSIRIESIPAGIVPQNRHVRPVLIAIGVTVETSMGAGIVCSDV